MSVGKKYRESSHSCLYYQENLDAAQKLKERYKKQICPMEIFIRFYIYFTEKPGML